MIAPTSPPSCATGCCAPGQATPQEPCSPASCPTPAASSHNGPAAPAGSTSTGPARGRPACACCATKPGGNPEEGHDHSHEHGGQEGRLLALAALLFFPTLALEHFQPGLLSPWLRVGLYAVPYLLCGVPVFRQAIALVRHKSLFNEFSLMCVATVAAIALGELPEAVGVMLFYRVGEYVQDKATASSRRSVESLLAVRPTVARVRRGGQEEVLPPEAVVQGDVVVVKAGEKFPVDGTVLEGSTQADQSPLTGESMPVLLEPGSTALGGSINLSGVVLVQASGPFAQSHMARILHLVESAAANKSPTERLITRLARYYTPAVVAAAVLVALLPPLIVPGATFAQWGYRALVLLVISCPCALLISIPLGYFGGIGAASRQGILVKGGTVLDSLLHVDTVVFDKTGTLTQGQFSVTHSAPAPGVAENTLLEVAARAERHSNHPIARSLVAHVEGLGLVTAPVQSHAPTEQQEDSQGPDAARITEIPGKGLLVEQGAEILLAGTAALLAEHGIAVPMLQDASGGTGYDEDGILAGAQVHVAQNGTYLGCVVLADTIKPEAAKAIAALHAMGKKTFMLTGDNAAAAGRVATATGIGGYTAGLLPEGKVAAMEQLAGADRVMFVGDGINDAPILTTARVGVAMGGVGAEAAIEAADAVIVNDSPMNVPALFTLATRVRAIVVQNICLALGIKTLFMALGVVGMSNLWEAVFADVGVALLAVLNATRAARRE
ncbi:heavy metal translocating P-type ATPase [Desulfovibrio cuneatus]|uniref:heavy metal translocating P-type ATPase n=1 Tax=Desulfovibrio cuneatus TaxID=159728 RepID=UPI0003FD0C8D|nr:heavy metal translocating P-type ATPase [Desulfovibrio cuneatus]